MSWCSKDDVRLKLATVSDQLTDEDITKRQDEAEGLIKSRLSAAYPIGTIQGWETVCPPRIVQLAADMTALLILKHKTPDFKGRIGDRETTFKYMDDLVEGKYELLDATGEIIPRTTKSVRSSKTNKTPVFSMGNKATAR